MLWIQSYNTRVHFLLEKVAVVDYLEYCAICCNIYTIRILPPLSPFLCQLMPMYKCTLNNRSQLNFKDFGNKDTATHEREGLKIKE